MFLEVKNLDISTHHTIYKIAKSYTVSIQAKNKSAEANLYLIFTPDLVNRLSGNKGYNSILWANKLKG
jgi:hypothetical protein